MPIDVTTSEIISQLPEALKELNAADREILSALYSENKTYAEIATQCSESETTIRRMGQRAMMKLERLNQFLFAMKWKNLPAHYRRFLCAARFRGWTVERIADEFGLSEASARCLLQSAEAWMQSPPGAP
jgi:DNA-directed RNA polymerase specialized sigma24 family protein